jgi:Ca2+-binding RTX toxin-like protein
MAARERAGQVVALAAQIILLLLIAAAPASAATVEGTGDQEVLMESNRDDTIYGRGGTDYIKAGVFIGIGDRDVAYGNAGHDSIDVDDGDGKDTAKGGNGDDICYGDPHDEFIGCEEVRINPNK